MPEVYGVGDFRYEFVEDWAKLPDGVNFQECPGVACDSNDNVFVLTRGKQPIMVFDRDGNYMRSFGEGLFSDNRTHGLYIGHDDSVLAADDGIHTIQKFSSNGEKVWELGERNNPAARWSGEPFNRPTSAATRPSNGDIYVSDGYGNSRVHVYSEPARVQVLLGRARHRRRPVHPPPQHRLRQQRPGLRRRPRSPSDTDFRLRRQLHYHVEQYSPPRCHGAVG